MPGDETQEGERRETIQELSDLLSVTEEMGQRLLDETHGEGYDAVRELIELFHQCRGKVDQIGQVDNRPIPLPFAEVNPMRRPLQP